MNVLLTGSSGFLGSILDNVLAEENFNVRDINSFSKSRIDISKAFELSLPPDDYVVIHSAAKAHSTPRNSEEIKAFFDVNFGGTKNLCDALDKSQVKIKSFIFISTVSVYGVENGENISEDHPLNATSPYGQSKIQAENYLKEWGRDKNIPVLILRLPLVAAPGPPGNLGKMISGIRSGMYLSINQGKAKRSIVMARDVAYCISKNLGKQGTYNLTDGYSPSFREMECTIAKQLNKPVPRGLPGSVGVILGKIGDFIPGSPIKSDTISKMSNNLTFDDSRARRELDWDPSKVIDVFTI